MDVLWKRALREVGDRQFGPQSGHYPDFTLRFEDAIFTIGPSGLLIFLTPFYVWYYLGLPGSNGALFVLQVVSAILYNPAGDSTGISVASSAMACLATFALAVLMHFEHRHALESSPLPALYLFVTLLLDIAKARSYFLRSADGQYSLGCVTAAITGTKLVLLILGELPKRYRVKREALGRESSQGFWGRTFFVWLNSTLLLGFRNILANDDLPHLDPGFASARLAALFEPVWLKRKSSSLTLLISTFRSQIWSFLAVIPPRLLHVGFTFAEPLLLRRTLQQIDRQTQDADTTKGLIGAMTLVQCGSAITRVWYEHSNNVVITKTRGILISQILRKSFLLRPNEAKRAAATTLMSTDVDGIVTVIPSIHETWASVVRLAISVYLLSTVISQSAFLTMLPALAATVISLEVGKRLAPATKSWNENIEKRVSTTSRILSQLRGIKMIAAESAVANYVHFLREAEIGYSKGVRKLTTATTLALTSSFALTPIVVLAGALFWSGFNNGFNAVDVFTALAFIYLASQPMAAILNSWSRIGGLIACFGRIQAYLLLEERADGRDQIPEQSDEKATAPLEKAPPRDIEKFPIQLANAAISSASGRVLFTANVSFVRSTITMIIGPTGVGKSTLLRAILGEAKLASGSIFVQPQHIAYCDQEEWIRNIAIRDNIIGENAYDEEWYKTVTTACLLRDVSEFSHGDLTLAGSRGANLSGGQRQRVALARAVYSRASLLLLDDPLSALDRHSSSTILKQLVGSGGLLRTNQATVVMSTHSVELLKSADEALVIQPNQLAMTQSPESAIKKYEGQGFLDDFSDDSEDISDGGSRDDSPARHYTPPQPKPQASTRLRQTGDLKLYKYYLKSARVSVFLLWLFILVLLVVTEKGPDIYIRLWVERAPENKELFVGYAIFGSSTLAVNVLWTWMYFIHLVPQSAGSLHRVLLHSVSTATLSFLTYTDSGALLNRFSQDMSLIIKDLPIAFFYGSYVLGGLLITVAIIASAVRYAATIVPVLLILLILLQLFYLRTSRQMRLLDIEAKSPIYTHLTECSEGIHHIRAFHWEKQYLDKGLDLLDKSQKPSYYRYCLQRWLSLVLDLTVAAVGVLLVALGLNMGSTSQAALGLGLLMVMQINPLLIRFVETWVTLETSLGAVSRIRSFENETPQEGYGAGEDGTASVPDNWPHQGQVEVNNVDADYTIQDTDYRALHEISVKIEAGTKVGLVGRTGSGKSSFLLTLLNLLKFSGSITIDGIDIKTIPRHTLRSRITTISQDFMDLPGSVRDNLVPQEIMRKPGDRISDNTLLSALEKVGLKGLVESRGGLDKCLDEVGLSAGEQQLLALARALVHHGRTKGKLIFVDEATSHIDYDSEEKLRDVTTEAFKDCTVITIAHRYHTLNNSTLLELSAGHLVAYG